jgi:translation initiation factor eIF-2B subunit delta/methylthioribose-1-phosphate isomerase
MKDWRREVARLAADRRHGAAWLTLRAAGLLEGLAAQQFTSAAKMREELLTAAGDIAVAHPSMAPLTNTAAVFAASLPRTEDHALLAMEARSAARGLRAYWVEAPAALAQRHAPRLTGTVMSHSSSSDVLRTLLLARPAQVFLTESRPGRESGDTARALTAAGLAVTMIPDSAGGHFIPGVDAVVLGADSLLPNGDVVNKVGSYPLALAALDRGRPVFVLAETMKVSPDPEPSLTLATERQLGRPPARVAFESPLFERIPRHCVSAILTEDGELDLPTIAHLAQVFEEQRRALVAGSPAGAASHSPPAVAP